MCRYGGLGDPKCRGTKAEVVLCTLPTVYISVCLWTVYPRNVTTMQNALSDNQNKKRRLRSKMDVIQTRVAEVGRQ